MIKNGFTTIELLVVITMITIIGSIIFSSFYNSRLSGRDMKRRGDILAMQQSFEQYFADNGQYDDTDCRNMGGYIQGIYPEDPIGAPDWDDYAEGCNDVSNYCVCAHLERPQTGNAVDDACDFASAGDKDYFCVQNQQ